MSRVRRFPASHVLSLPVFAWIAVPVAALLGSQLGRSPPPGPRAVSDPPPRPRAVRAWVGFRLDETPGEGGARLAEVDAGGPAARAGLVAGDAILSLEGAPPTGAALARLLATVEPGTRLALERRRGSGREALTLVVADARDTPAILSRALATGRRALVALQGPDGLWRAGPAPDLAASALACAALAAVTSGSPRGPELERGTAALLARRAPDGGLLAAVPEGELASPRRVVLAEAALLLALPPGSARDGLRETLARRQLSEARGHDPRDGQHGGWDAIEGAAPAELAAWVLEGLAAAELPRDRPEWDRAARFLERSRAGDGTRAPVTAGAALRARALRGARDPSSARERETLARALVAAQDPARGCWRDPAGEDEAEPTALALLALAALRDSL